MFDSATQRKTFISTGDTVKSIYEIEGARSSYWIPFIPKLFGFLQVHWYPTRVVQKEVTGKLNLATSAFESIWRQNPSMPLIAAYLIYVQRGAEAVYSKEGREQTRANIAYYKRKCTHHQKKASNPLALLFTAALMHHIFGLKHLATWQAGNYSIFFLKRYKSCLHQALVSVHMVKVTFV